MEFEHLFGGAMTASGSVTILDPDVGAYAPTTIIQRDHAWAIKVDWKIVGPPTLALGGKWRVRAYLESLGQQFEGQVGPTKEVDLSVSPPDPVTKTRTYTTTIDVPAATSIPNLDDGAYRLVTLVNYENMGVPGEIAGFQDGPIMQFYTAT